MFRTMSRVSGSIETGPRGFMPFIADQRVAGRVAVGLFERLGDERHAVVGADGHEIRPHAVMLLDFSKAATKALFSAESWSAGS